MPVRVSDSSNIVQFFEKRRWGILRDINFGSESVEFRNPVCGRDLCVSSLVMECPDRAKQFDSSVL
jgi:hypothetical protein